MDGVPIGRKIDLNAYDSYEKLSSAVDELFRGLLAGKIFTRILQVVILMIDRLVGESMTIIVWDINCMCLEH